MKDFILYPEALELKQLGFDEPCFGVYATKDGYVRKSAYDEIGDAPTYSQAFRWFREKYNLHALIMPKTTPSNTTVYYIYKGKFEKNWNNCFETYEEAELACLKEMIKIVKTTR